MKKLISIIQKESLHIIRDWRTLMILILMPIALVVIFGFAISNEIRNIKTVVIDPSGDVHSLELIRRMEASNYFKIIAYEDHKEALERLFRRGKAHVAVVFPVNFGNDFEKNKSNSIQVIADASEPNNASIISSYIEGIVQTYQMELAGGRITGMSIIPELRMLYNPGLKSVYLFVPGIITIILMLICALMTSLALTREKEFGNMELLLASPLHPALVILGKVIPYVALSFIDLLLILVLGDLVFDVPVRGSLVLLLMESLLYISTSLSLGIFISTVTSTQQAAMIFSMIALFLPTVLLSGFIFPIESMPEILQWISHIIPAKWFIIIIKGVMLQGSTLDIIWKETLILSLMTLVFITASIQKFKIRLE